MELKEKSKSNEKFFNSISTFYDEMISFSSALQRRKNLLSKFVTNEIKTAADLGCGTGMDSISLSMLGLRVTGFDTSEEMINKAKNNSKNSGFNIDFNKSSVEKIPISYNNKFDLVVSLGNTLANVDEKKLAKGVLKISKILAKNGTVVIQILNYAKLVKTNERIVNINDSNDEIYVRFYDFLPQHINFNILKINKNDYSKRELFTTFLYPHSKELFFDLLKKNGFNRIKFYGGLDLKPYKKLASNDLVILAKK